MMNDKFYSLPEEKQRRIINAGYRVFSLNSYKKSPMSEIAAEAGISKSLLFHYFKNKRELYLFLWDEAVRFAKMSMQKTYCYDTDDFFEMMRRGLYEKVRLMRIHPYMAVFTVRAFYEKEPGISEAVQGSYQALTAAASAEAISRLGTAQFKEGIDLEMMLRQMYLASEGYMWEMVQRGDIDAEKLQADGERMVSFWKEIYGK